MHIYFSGIGGVAIGPLAEIARDAGHTISGSDAATGLMTEQLARQGIAVHIGQDDGYIARRHEAEAIDWFVYTASLPANHPELVFAREHQIRTSKRDELLATLIEEQGLRLLAVSGTHGKTTTTGLLVWAFQQLGVPVSYSVGSTLSFGPSGKYDPASRYFVYECDEFDRNMLHFTPSLSLITSLDYDHVETYPTADDYRQAFVQFLSQSAFTMLWEKDLRYLRTDPVADLEAYDEHMDLSHITLAGDHLRHNAYLVERALLRLFPDLPATQVQAAINTFPGTGRRMEQLAPGLYSDYGHHPAEISATLQMARELSDHVVLVYQPHQNVRQHEIKDEYRDSMKAAEHIYWLPTYLTRETSDLPVLSPEELIASLDNHHAAEAADMDQRLWSTLMRHRQEGKLVLLMGAGSIDGWARQQLAATK